MNKFYSGANEYVLKTGDSMTGKLSAPDFSTDVVIVETSDHA